MMMIIIPCVFKLRERGGEYNNALKVGIHASLLIGSIVAHIGSIIAQR